MAEQPTNVEIFLTAESHRCLMDHVPGQSSALKSLEAAGYFEGAKNMPEVVVKCDLAAAEVLLEVANRNCKAAADDIKIAINVYKSEARQS